MTDNKIVGKTTKIKEIYLKLVEKAWNNMEDVSDLLENVFINEEEYSMKIEQYSKILEKNLLKNDGKNNTRFRDS